jgi:hypothetical protein
VADVDVVGDEGRAEEPSCEPADEHRLDVVADQDAQRTDRVERHERVATEARSSSAADSAAAASSRRYHPILQEQTRYKRR